MKNKLKFVEYHLPCPSCNSSDALSLNENGSAKCFSCGKFFSKYNSNAEIRSDVVDFKDINGGIYAPLSDRYISQQTAEKYRVKSIFDSRGVITQHLYPYYIHNELTATKIRTIKDKDFIWKGSSTGTGLFGQNLFKEGGKYITITEGECDAMAAYELLGSKWAVISIKHGAPSAITNIKENLEYVESFDNIVICFDSDKEGQQAAIKVARILKPGKAKILTLPTGFKDANEMLIKKEYEKFVRSWWDAKVYTPSGIIRVSEKEKDFLHREKKDSVPYPWKGLNEKLYGLRQGELVTLTGGSGL